MNPGVGSVILYGHIAWHMKETQCSRTDCIQCGHNCRPVNMGSFLLTKKKYIVNRGQHIRITQMSIVDNNRIIVHTIYIEYFGV